MPSPSVTTQLIRSEMNDNGALGAILDRFALYNPFNLLPAAVQAAGTDWDFDLVGTGTVLTPAQQSNGGILIATRTALAADNDSAGLFPLTSSPWGTAITPGAGARPLWEASIKTGASIAETAIIFGLKLTDTVVYATDNDQVLFVFDTDNLTLSTNYTVNSRWATVESIGGVDSAFDAGGDAVAAATNYRLSIQLDDDRRATMKINDRIVRVTNALTSNAALLPVFYVVSRVNAGAAKSHIMRWIRRGIKLV